jgi:hypothetical protein
MQEPTLPILNTANDYDVSDPYHTPSDSTSSNASSVSVAQSTASSRSSPPLSEGSEVIHSGSMGMYAELIYPYMAVQLRVISNEPTSGA